MSTPAPTVIPGGVSNFTVQPGQQYSTGGTTTTPPTASDTGTPLPPTNPTTPPQPPAPQTSFSSDSANQTNQTNTQKLQNYGQAGLGMDTNGYAINADRSFAEAPAGSVPNANGGFTDPTTGINYYLGNSAGKISSDPYTQQLYDQFSALKSQMDATGAANIANIQAQYGSLIKQQEQTNTAQQASVDKSLLMGGSSRYAQISSAGQSSAMVSYGIQQIADLNSKENAAVIAAQQAMQDGDYKLLDKQLSIADSARQEKQAAAQKLSDTLTTQADTLKKQQAAANQDQAIATQLSNGVTDPAAIMKAINGTINPATGQPYALTSKDVVDTISNLNPDAKAIADLMTSAAKNGATPDQLKAIGGAKNIAGAIQAAGSGLIDPTSNLGQYQTYSQSAIAKGQVPLSYTKWDATNSANKAYSSAYSSAAGKNAADAEFASSSKGQDALEQQYRQVLVKELSNRTGDLGTQNSKVSQAIHLDTLVNQYKDAKGNYNIPTSQYAELALGLASLISPGGTTAESDRQAILAKTAKGDLNGALQYITGTPQNGNTQDMIKNLVDSINRQGGVAEDLRNTDVSFLQGLAPTGLSADRKAALEANLLPSFRNPPTDPVAKATADETAAAAAIKTYDAASPDNQKRVDDLHAKFPNASATDIKAALGI